MEKKALLLKNTSAGLFGQIVSVVIQFVTRYFFVRYLSVDLLGLSSTLMSLLNALSLTELGFQTAVVYNLYKPLADNDTKTINSIINIFKIVYRCIGVIFIIASIILCPFVKYILTDIEINIGVYIIFIIHAWTSAFSYFLSYKRALLYADQKDYISKIADAGTNFLFGVLRIVGIVVFKNYYIYLILQLLQIICSNIIVHLYANSKYSYLKAEKIDTVLLKKIFYNVKDVFVGRIAGYIYRSTDNLIISIMVSTVSVGYLVNYTTITNNLKTLMTSFLGPITPFIGNLLAGKHNEDSKYNMFCIYSYVRYVISSVIIVPLVVLIQGFIGWWVGEQFCLSSLIVFFLAVDLYISFVYGVCIDFINVAGLFKKDKKVEIVGAICNIVFSVGLTYVMGLAGVLLGTVLTQIVFWSGRSYMVYKYCLGKDMASYTRYWIKNIYDMVVVILSITLSMVIANYIHFKLYVMEFVAVGIVSVAIFVALCYATHFFTKSHKELVNLLKK